jgi:hypothetical protein
VPFFALVQLHILRTACVVLFIDWFCPFFVHGHLSNIFDGQLIPKILKLKKQRRSMMLGEFCVMLSRKGSHKCTMKSVKQLWFFITLE